MASAYGLMEKSWMFSGVSSMVVWVLFIRWKYNSVNYYAGVCTSTVVKALC
jgi:hypothetical protein